MAELTINPLHYSADGVTWNPAVSSSVPDSAVSFGASTVSSVRIDLTWGASPTPNDQMGWMVRYQTGSVAPASPEAGTLLNMFAPGAGSVSHTGLTGSTTYSYSIWGYTRENTFGLVRTASATTNVGIPDAPSISWSNMGATYNNLTATWPAAARAVSYNIYLAWTGQGKYLYQNQTNTDFSWGFGAMDTLHELWVESVGAGGEKSGQSYLRGCSGHPQASKQGSFTFEGRPSATKTWRPSDGWTYSANGDDVLQGYYTASNNNAFGTMQHDGPGFQNWVASNYGWDVVSNMGFDDFALAMYRMSGSGTGSAVSQTYYVSPAQCSVGGQPPLAGGTAMGSHLPNNAGSWDRGLPNWWAGHVLRNEDVGQGPCWSFVMQRNNAADYSRYGGLSDFGNSCNYYIACSWNFVTQNQQNTYAC